MSTIYRVPSGAMNPTLALGQRVEVDEDAYHAASPAVGDIVVFYAPLNVEPAQPGDAAAGAACAVSRPGPGPGRYIKRIVAGAGDVISIARGFVVRNGITETSDHVKAGDERLDQDFPTPIVIPPDAWYLLGDNRARSIDSRWWGPIPTAWIIGKIKPPAPPPDDRDQGLAPPPANPSGSLVVSEPVAVPSPLERARASQ